MWLTPTLHSKPVFFLLRVRALSLSLCVSGVLSLSFSLRMGAQKRKKLREILSIGFVLYYTASIAAHGLSCTSACVCVAARKV